MHYYVFNGDADGICALQQMRLAHPIAEAQYISGLKRDNRLLDHLENVHSSTVTVLDISLANNRSMLLKLLDQQNRTVYIDHHYAGEIPSSPFLTTHIDSHSEICTSLLVNKLLAGKHGKWAICGAFGDNLHKPAQRLATSLSIHEKQTQQLREVGELLNYNSYGETLDDVRFPPLKICNVLEHYIDPLDFFTAPDIIPVLRSVFQEDMKCALTLQAHGPVGKNRVYFLPDRPWARRIAGIFANFKAREKIHAAHALVTKNSDGTFRISIRAPLAACKNADTVCRLFPTGGGRPGAAGINALPPEMIDSFLSAFYDMYR